ncbi:hypothetical protein GCM10010276_34080 [Streptomyces longisporus]|uniref:Uncharacterized protein n=1 Tax=Streptomyces longisporus TaxID=1948 RepID=A0ABP5Z661_STRLO
MRTRPRPGRLAGRLAAGPDAKAEKVRVEAERQDVSHWGKRPAGDAISLIVQRVVRRPTFSRVAGLRVRYLPYGELQANREAIMRCGTGLHPGRGRWSRLRHVAQVVEWTGVTLRTKGLSRISARRRETQ